MGEGGKGSMVEGTGRELEKMKEREKRDGGGRQRVYGRGDGKRVRENEGERKERWGREAKGLW